MSRLLGDGHFGTDWCARDFCNSPCNPSGELGMSIFAVSNRIAIAVLLRASLVVKSQGRPARLPPTFAIVIFCRRPLTVVRGCRRSFYVVFWRSRCLNCRTVVIWICPMCEKYRTLSNFDLAWASRWAEVSKIGFWRPSKTDTIPYMLPV